MYVVLTNDFFGIFDSLFCDELLFVKGVGSILFISILLLFILTIYNSDPFVDYIYHFYKRRKKQ